MSKGPLRQLIQGPLTQKANLLEIKDVLADTGQAWNRIPFELPSDVRAMIQATPISITSRGRDRISWLGNPRGTFDLKSAYGIATNEDSEVTTSSFGWIWKLKTLPRNYYISITIDYVLIFINLILITGNKRFEPQMTLLKYQKVSLIELQDF